MNPVRRLFRQGSVYTIGAVVQLSASAVVLPIVTRLLEPSEYGVVALVLALNVVVAALVGLGIPAAITREFFEHDEVLDPRATTLIVTTGLVALLGAAIVAATIPLWQPAIAPGQGTALLLGVVIAVPAATAGAASSLLLVQERPIGYTAIVLAGSLGAQVMGIGALLLISRDATAYLSGYLVGAVAGAVIGLVLSGAVGVGPAPRDVLRRALSLGLPTVPHSLAIFVLALGDRIVIQAVSDSREVGRYQVAYALGSLGLAFLAALQNAWVPITFSLTHAERWRSLAGMTTLVTRLGALAAVGLTLVAPYGLELLAPADYDAEDLEPVVAIIAASAIAWAIYLPMSQVLFWERYTRPLAWITPLAATLNLALVAVLTPAWGLEGAALATLVALSLQAALCARAAGRVADVPWEVSHGAVTVGLGAAGVAAMLLLPDGGAGLALRVLIAAGLIATAYGLVRRELRAQPADPS